MKSSNTFYKVLGALIFFGVLVFLSNRPKGFLPGWIKTLSWHLSNDHVVSINGLTVKIPLVWWTAFSDSGEMTLLRAPAWNSEYSGSFTIRKGCRTENQFDSLLSAKEIGGDSIISVEEERIMISGQYFRGARLNIHDESTGEDLVFETYPIFSKGITINIADHPIELRNQLNELFVNIHL